MTEKRDEIQDAPEEDYEGEAMDYQLDENAQKTEGKLAADQIEEGQEVKDQGEDQEMQEPEVQ